MGRRRRKSIKVMTFNVAHGRGRRFHQTFVRRPTMEQNLQAIAKHILDHHPHIVALQEIDQGSFWNHHVDQLSYLQELTEYAHAHHGIHQEDFLFFQRLVVKYGVGILSRLPPRDFTSQRFSLGRLDSKGYTSKRLSFAGKDLLIVALHLDFRLDRYRYRQLEQVIDHVRNERSPEDSLVIMGDFNCTLRKRSSPLRHVMEELKLHTFEPVDEKHHMSYPGLLARRLDYILIDHSLEFLSYRTGSARISDHEYVVAKILIR